MRRFMLAAALFAGPAMADMEARNEGGDVLRITREPCPPAVLKVIPEGHRGVFRLALATVGGTTYRACWALRVDAMVMIVYDDGESGLVPIAMFKQLGDL